MGPWVARALAAAAWAGLAAGLAFGHPVLARPGALADLGRGLAEDAARARTLAGRLALVDRGAVPALVALELALLYVAGWLLLRLPRSPDGTGGPDGRGALALGAAAVAHGAGVVSAVRGGGDLAFFLVTDGTAAVLLSVAVARSGAGPPAPAPARPRPARLAAGVAGGLLLVLLAAPLDAALATLAATPIFPEPWLPVAIRLGSGVGVPAGLLLAAAVAAAAFGLERLAGGAGRRAGALVLAPAYALVLGPSNPVKALALALGTGRLAAAGVGWRSRALFALATVALFVGLALAA